MSTECRIIRRFVMAEAGIPDKLKRKVFRIIVQNAVIKFSDFQH